MSQHLTEEHRRFLERQRVARLATADASAAPHVVPVCYAVSGDSVYITLDEKPKQAAARAMKRLRNIEENPQVALVADHYDDDWSQLGWVMVRGTADILEDGGEHADAQALLRERYPQYRTMNLADLPVIAVRIERVASWGNLARSSSA